MTLKATVKADLANQLLECLKMWDVSENDSADIVRLMADSLKAKGMPENPLDGTGLTVLTEPENNPKKDLPN